MISLKSMHMSTQQAKIATSAPAAEPPPARTTIADPPKSEPRCEPELVLSVKRLTERLQLSRSSLYKLWKDGRGPACIKIGRRRLVTAAALAAWLEQCEAADVRL